MLEAIHNLFNNPTLRRVLVKSRVPLALAACVGLALEMKQEWFYRGLAVGMLGAFLQWWCFACLKKQKILAMNGPYGFVRNPMYLARYLLVLGGFVMTGNPWLVGGMTILYVFYMVNRVGHEEKTLSGIFGPEYDAYCKVVPRFIPSLNNHPDGQGLYWSWELFRRNHGPVNAIGVLAAFAAFWWFLFKCCGA